jgi:hypothetical protein
MKNTELNENYSIAFDEKLKAEKIRIAIYTNMSPLQKWEQVWQLREIAWQIQRDAIKAQHPKWSEQEVEKEVKRKFLYAVT